MQKKNTGIHTVYVGNLNYNDSEDHILGLFKQYGYIKNIKILREGKQNKSKGVAFVDMIDLKDAKIAIEELNGKIHNGRQLKVNMADTQNFKETKVKNPVNLKLTNDNLVKKERRLKKRAEIKTLFTKKK